jgi:hypothetical protein
MLLWFVSYGVLMAGYVLSRRASQEKVVIRQHYDVSLTYNDPTQFDPKHTLVASDYQYECVHKIWGCIFYVR